jgi:hypothetical protein
MKRLLIKSWPYLTSFTSGILLFLISLRLQEDFKGLLINVSATLLAVPLLFLIYELAKGFSSRKLNKELFDYAKMQIDREALSIVMQLIKIVYPYKKQDKSEKGVQTFLNQSIQNFRDVFAKESFLGFQVLKRWTVSEGNLAKILENPFILQRLQDDQAIAITTLLKTVQHLEDLHRNIGDLFEISDTKDDQFVTKSGNQINEKNTEFPDRHLLLKRLSRDKYQVMDFGDFVPYELPNLLKICKVNSKYADVLANAVFDIVQAVGDWLSSTGDEFIIDTRMFRMSGARLTSGSSCYVKSQ